MFTDIYFLFLFLPVLLVVVRNIPCRAQKALLMIVSIALYMVSAGVKGLACALTILVNYLFHLWINSSKSRAVSGVCIGFDAALLLAAKLTGFMPLGASFIIFQLISLLIDLKDDKTSFEDYLFLTFFFPKILMGPIIRAKDIKPDLIRSKSESLVRPDGLEEGLKLYTAGLFMKCVLADNLATLWHSISISGVLGITTPTAWLGALTYSLELYFDFWGYSLMALALGRMLGMSVPENFNEPYSSYGVGDFWRRWHITLGEWFRDYVYIPMGGKRRGKARCIFNLLIVWLLTALWHGITVNFLIWGLYLFILIAMERFTFWGYITRIPVLRNIYLVFVIVISWVIFAIPSAGDLWIYIKCLFGIYDEETAASGLQFVRYVRTYWHLIAVAVLFATPLPRMLYNRFSGRKWCVIPLLGMLGLSVYFCVHNQNNVFMYYGF